MHIYIFKFQWQSILRYFYLNKGYVNNLDQIKLKLWIVVSALYILNIEVVWHMVQVKISTLSGCFLLQLDFVCLSNQC